MRVKITARDATRKVAARQVQKLMNWYLKKIEQHYPEQEQLMDMMLQGTLNIARWNKAKRQALKASTMTAVTAASSSQWAGAGTSVGDADPAQSVQLKEAP